ncbi:hypothetical protein DL768_002477 [Monosporascus sp. mg162]|nr:hypothetical protein DL768_002477 [Monosporascus sp. mg162]
MRLLQLRGNDELTLTDNLIHDIPPYAILSHTWGRDGEEVTFQELMEKRGKHKIGYEKIVFCGQQAQRDGLQYFWVDTCCIDKTSSAELTEAINSMFDWYRKAERCYVYLADVCKDNGAETDELSRSRWKSAFRASRWFTRGWTLQELIAPSRVEFFSSNHQRLGDKKSLEHTIHEVTRIPLRALQGSPLPEFTIEQRISWSKGRRTTRPEDKAYSLLGILGVHMPLIYGEGEDEAFDRLQREVDHRNGGDRGESSYAKDKIDREIRERLFGYESCQKLAVVGLGGMGKTQVALQLAYWVKEHQPDYSVLWLPAISLESFEQTVTEVARRIGIKKKTDDEDIKTLFSRHLERDSDRKWFLLVDNADDMDVLYGSADSTLEGIYQYVPMSENCVVLFTTRSRDVALSVAETDVIELEELNLEEATTLLTKSVIRKQLLQDEEMTRELLKELTHLPLAIAQAAAYLNRNQVSLKRYLELLRSTEKETVSLMSIEFHDNTRYRGSQNAVATTWLVSFDRIRRTDPTAADLLLFMSLIEPRGIPRSLLPQTQTEASMDYAIGTLCGHAFLADRGGQLYDMHRWTEGWIPKDDRTQLTLEHWLAMAYINDRQIKTAIPMLEHVVEVRTRTLTEEDHVRLTSENNLAGAYLDDGQTKKAIAMLEHVVEVWTRTLTEEDHSRLASQHNLARAYLDDGQIQKAIPMLEHIVEVRTRTLAEEDDSRLASQHNLARAYLDDRQTKKAIPMLEHIVEVQTRTLTEEDDSRLPSEYNLARAYLEDDRQIQKAIAMLEHVVEVRTRTLAEEDDSRLASEFAFATAYLSDRQIRKAIDLLEHVVAGQSLISSEDDPERLALVDWLTKAHKQLKVESDGG